jgi:hypothetical protein
MHKVMCKCTGPVCIFFWGLTCDNGSKCTNYTRISSRYKAREVNRDLGSVK